MMDELDNDTWILNATLVTQDAKRRIIKGHLRLKNGRIAEIKKSAPQVTDESNVIDAAGETLFPGFVQAHVHLCQTLFRNQADDLIETSGAFALIDKPFRVDDLLIQINGCLQRAA